MKNIKILLALSLLITVFPVKLKAQWVYSQFFENTPNITDTVEYVIDSLSKKTWEIGKPAKTIFKNALTNPNVLITNTNHSYDTSISANVIFRIAGVGPIWERQNFALRWSQQLDLENNKDFAFVYISVDSGASWANATDYNPNINYNFYGFNAENIGTDSSSLQKGFTGSDSIWRDIWLCLYGDESAVGKIFLKFVFKSDSVQSNHEGWMIDNFQFHPIIIHTVASDLKNKNSFVAFPNITNGVLNVESTFEGEDKKINAIYLYDSFGKLLKEYVGVSKRVTLDLGQYPDGIYFVKPITKYKSELLKVVLKH